MSSQRQKSYHRQKSYLGVSVRRLDTNSIEQIDAHTVLRIMKQFGQNRVVLNENGESDSTEQRNHSNIEMYKYTRKGSVET
jgi:hypothetical protein